MRRLLPALLLFIVVGCRGGDSAPQRRTLIDSRDTYDPRTLDPALATDVPSGRAVAYVFDGLTRFTPDARLEPALAERWDVSPDGKVYTFHLRRGVRFHDGTSFVARHVLKSFHRVLDPTTKSTGPWVLYPIDGAREFADRRDPSIRGLVAVDDSTVRITLGQPLSIFLKLLAMPVASIVPDSVGPDFREHPVGTGPWKFVEWRHDDYLLFAKNPDYFDGAPRTDSLRARIIREPSTAVAEFEVGNVDLLYVPEAETRRWEQTDERNATLAAAPALRLWYVGINTTRGPLRDVRVRQAINHAIDVDIILDRLIGGRGRRAAGVIPPVLDGADTTRTPYAHDIGRAKQLLTQAGFPNGIDIELWHSDNESFSRVAQSIQSYLAEADIRAKLVQREAAAMRAAARNGETDMVLKDWYADYPDAENFLYPLLHTTNRGLGGNVSFYSNREFDGLVDQSRIELDSARRVELYRRADSIAFADAPMAFLFFYNELYAVQPWVSGFQVPVIFNGQRWVEAELR
ncbi:MAG TPA: ABC transporter substrate-binding protein [Gemmatimonadaceae bacterium]|nr:ABC transporter substrate-binding protein [Gemmatimonadaceae bacterium]